MVEQIDVVTLAHARGDATVGPLKSAVLLDVREPWEFELARIADSINIPMSTLGGRVEEVRALQETAADAPVVVICHHGSRSMHCAQFLSSQGLDKLINLSGGIDAWSTRVDPAVPRY
jgi:rhodanese-related sulfurtransferase